ncbi:MAG TPA: OmpA family protein [Polyangiaceae bacterium]|jgi:chemotaxis protein MotB|nr:OmpA family protein [Polyangiaceae bacterium]
MKTAGLVICAALFATACGYSEDQWQAQLSKYNQLKSDDDAKLADAKKKVADLTKKLEAMGVDVTSMKSDLDEREKALESYKERARQLELIKERFEKLKAKLDTLTKLGLAVNVRHNRMVISLPGDVLFDSGHETLKKDGKDILLKVATIIKADPQLVSRDYQVAGDTDDQPFTHGAFKDNWGLSLMRAREVLVFLINAKDGGGLPVQHWSAAGFADTDPVAPNTTPEGRQKNRRCELIVLPSVEEMLDLKTITQ